MLEDLFDRDIICSTPEASLAVAREFSSHLKGGDVVLLFGEVGAGKTFMSTEVVKCLGGDERLVGSPSFTLVNIYPISMGQFYHIDLYRLQGVVDEDDIDQDQWMEPDPHSISFIEWAERLDDWEPQQGYRCMIRHLEDGRCVRLERIH